MLERGGHTVVAEVRTAAEALRAARVAHADLVLLDILLPDGDGIDVADGIARLPLPPGVVLVSSRGAVEFGQRLADAPVLGFVRKDDLSLARLAELVR